MSTIVLTQAEIEALIDSRIEARLSQVATESNKDVLSMAEVAQLLGKHPKTIRKLVLNRGLPVSNSAGREPRFIRADVMAWLEKSS